MSYKSEEIKYLLFNRRTICKYENKTVYSRDINEHTWKYDHYHDVDYLYEHDCLVEEIDYDEQNEEIMSIRRSPGEWSSEDYIEGFIPSPQVAQFLEKTGITYTDIYGNYGRKDANPSDRSASLLDLYPDLLEGAPGSENL